MGGYPSNESKAIDGVVDFFRRPAITDSKHEGNQPQLITRLGSWIYPAFARRKILEGSIRDTYLDQDRNVVIGEWLC